MTTQTDRYDQAAALCQLADDGCPNHGDTAEGSRARAGTTGRGPLASCPQSSCACRGLICGLKQLLRKERRLARTDALTGLRNRLSIEEVAAAEARRRDRYPGFLTVGLIDIDRFKAVNDRFLLPGGDHALVGVARAIDGALRQTDRLGRWGGDEFLVVAPQTAAAGAEALAARIRAGVAAAAIRYRGEDLRPTVSMGFAVAAQGVAADYGLLLHVAARALRDAKEGGRDAYVIRPVPALLVRG